MTLHAIPMAIIKKATLYIIYSLFNRQAMEWRKIKNPKPIKNIIQLNFPEMIWPKIRVATVNLLNPIAFVQISPCGF
ncbi:MAG: hypothetical protein U9R17_00065 [Thermodesulfobacteriota bacterium]|nr:hypothetical protein [Thermodesulfobacteriota bacterium]